MDLSFVQAGEQSVRRNTNRAKIREYKQLFDMYDTDGNGTLDLQEMIMAFSS